MSILLHIADRVLNTPLLITPDKAQVILSVLSGRIGLDKIDMSRFEGSDLVVDEKNRKVKQKPYQVTDKGVGIITVTGSLVNRGAWIGANSGLTSYEGIQHQLKSARDDSDVKSVILDLHTPGGEGVGAFETAAMVRDLSSTKRTVALVNGIAASAGYAIASGANEIITTESGMSGSIGVVLLHLNRAQEMAEKGIEPTLIFAGAHKVDANPLEPLSEEVRADLQAEVDNMYEMFTKAVGKGRGSKLTAAMARKTEARTFSGKAAVDAGLADRIGDFQSVLMGLSRGSGRSTSSTRRLSMDENKGVPDASESGITPQDVIAAHARGLSEGTAAGLAEGTKLGAENERKRLSTIMSAEGISGNAARLSAALDLASESPEMSAEKVIAFTAKNVPEAVADVATLANRKNLPDSLGNVGGSVTPKSAADGWAKAAAKHNARFVATKN